jgi:hypothetical protein
MTDDLLRPPPPLATGARTGHPDDGDCAMCGLALGRGDRVATLPDGSTAHLPRIAATTPA